MTIDGNWIRAHIPHAGAMCLLHAVQRWDNAGIVCVAHSHRLADNPLRTEHGLPISAAVEYAAQSIAVHGALLAPAQTKPQIGYLTSVRNLKWQTPYLDRCDGALQVEANRISGNDSTLLYDFRVLCNAQVLMQGRASVMVAPAAAPQIAGAQ